MNKQKLASHTAAVAVILLLTPSLTLAQTLPSTTPTLGVCSDSTHAQQTLSTIAAYVDVSPFTAQKLDTSIPSARVAIDTQRASAIQALTTLARTSTQKAAVHAFTEDVHAAVAERRNAVDTALNQYADGIARLASDPKALVTPPLQYTQTVASQIRKAVLDCKAAFTRLTYTAQQLDVLSKTRAEAIGTADEAYRTRIQNAISAVSSFFK